MKYSYALVAAIAAATAAPSLAKAQNYRPGQQCVPAVADVERYQNCRLRIVNGAEICRCAIAPQAQRRLDRSITATGSVGRSVTGLSASRPTANDGWINPATGLGSGTTIGQDRDPTSTGSIGADSGSSRGEATGGAAAGGSIGSGSAGGMSGGNGSGRGGAVADNSGGGSSGGTVGGGNTGGSTGGGGGRSGGHGNNGHGNDADGNDSSNPGNSNNGDRSDQDGSPGGGHGGGRGDHGGGKGGHGGGNHGGQGNNGYGNGGGDGSPNGKDDTHR